MSSDTLLTMTPGGCTLLGESRGEAASLATPTRTRFGGIDAIRLVSAIAVVELHSQGPLGAYGAWRMPTMALIGCWFAVNSRSRHKELLRNFSLWAVLYACVHGYMAARHGQSVVDAVFSAVVFSPLWYIPFALTLGFVARKVMESVLLINSTILISIIVLSIPCPFRNSLAMSWWQVAPCIGLAVLCRSALDDQTLMILALAILLLGIPDGHRYGIALTLLTLAKHVKLAGGAMLATMSLGVYWTHPFVVLVLYKFQIQSPVTAIMASLATSFMIANTPFRRFI